MQDELFSIFKKVQNEIDQAGTKLVNPHYYDYFLKYRMEQNFIQQLQKFLINECNIASAQEASKLLNQFEAIANWERQSKGSQPFAVLTSEVVRISMPKTIKLTESQKEEFRNINEKQQQPAWFTVLPELTKKWLQTNAQRIIDGKLSCPTSVMRFIPGLANVREDLVFFTNDNGEVQQQSTTLRLAVPTPVDIKDKKEQIRITELNVEQVITELSDEEKQNQKLNAPKPFAIFQRLLSPVAVADKTGISGSDNNTLFIETTREAIKKQTSERDLKILTPNWPINSLRAIATNPFKDKENKKTRERLREYAFQLVMHLKVARKINLYSIAWLESCNKYFDSNQLRILGDVLRSTQNGISFGDQNQKQQFQLALEALVEYEFLWEQFDSHKKIKNPYGININLRMPALEMIIAEGLGLVTTSGCKSAKDREAVLTMEMTAIKRFYCKNKKIPKIDQTNDIKQMAKFFAEEFVSNYHQEVVSQGTSLGDSAIQDGKGILSLVEKLGIKIPQIIPSVYAKEIGILIYSEINQLNEVESKIALQTANKEFHRQDNLGKSASWGKIKTGIKKWMELLNGLLGKKKEPNIDGDPLNINEVREGDLVSLPSQQIQDDQMIYIVSDSIVEQEQNKLHRNAEEEQQQQQQHDISSEEELTEKYNNNKFFKKQKLSKKSNNEPDITAAEMARSAFGQGLCDS